MASFATSYTNIPRRVSSSLSTFTPSREKHKEEGEKLRLVPTKRMFVCAGSAHAAWAVIYSASPGALAAVKHCLHLVFSSRCSHQNES